MLDLMRSLWDSARDALIALAHGLGEALLVLYSAIGALPLPIGLIIITVGLALGEALYQRSERRDH